MKKIKVGVEICFIILLLAMLIFPFNHGGYNSQVLSITIFLILYFKYFLSIPKNKDIFIFFMFFILIYLVVLFGAFISLGVANTLVLYLIKIPVLFVVSYVVFIRFYLLTSSKVTTMRLIFLSGLPFLVFSFLQVLNADFYAFTREVLSTQVAEHFYENYIGGHPYRFLGWNGFMFADYSVSFGFLALFLLLFNTRNSGYLYILVEIAFIVFSVLAGRSGLPIILMYLLLLVLMGGFRRKLIYTIFSVFVLSYLMVFLDKDFLIWILEPLKSIFSSGRLDSNSLSETGLQYQEFFNNTRYTHAFWDVVVNGQYYKSNQEYYEYGLTGADSGYVRLFYALGLYGTVLYMLLWVAPMLGVILTKRNKVSIDVFLVFVYLLYSFIFTFKAEWIYQNYFIFYYFVFVFYLKFQVKEPDYENNTIRYNVSS